MTDKPRPALHTYGYLTAMLIVGISVGLLLYPLLTNPAIWQWLFLGIGLVLLTLSAPLLRKR